MRWNDLVRPEQNAPDGKGADAEASAFRNAFICDKKSLGNDVRYCIDFGNQKHLPSRIMKSVAEVEQILNDGKERYWFAETRIPLYLIKEYQEKAVTSKSLDMPKLQRRQGKASRKNIFSYLARKQDIITRSNCSSCQHDVLYRYFTDMFLFFSLSSLSFFSNFVNYKRFECFDLIFRDAVKCSSCQGIAMIFNLNLHHHFLNLSHSS